MRFKLILYLLSPGIAHLVLLVLGAWIEGHRAGGPNKRLVRKRLRRAPARAAFCAGPLAVQSLFPNLWRTAGTAPTCTAMTGKRWLPFPS